MQKICDTAVTDMEYYTFKKCTVAGIPEAIFSTTGYTGAGGCEVYVASEDGPKLWKAVFEAGAEYDIMPIGLGARDTLRLEMGFCLYGNDIDDSTSPVEAGLGWITKFSDAKGDFLDKNLLLNQKTNGVSRKLVGFKMIDKGVPRHGYEVLTKDGRVIGHVTSGTMSPMLKIGIGMAYVETAYAKPGTEVFIGVRDRLLKAGVVRPPFYKV
jgi:aminomethyltransferase